MAKKCQCLVQSGFFGPQRSDTSQSFGCYLDGSLYDFQGKIHLENSAGLESGCILIVTKYSEYIFFVKIVKIWPKSAKVLARLAFLDHNHLIPAKVLGVILMAGYRVFKGKSILKTALAWKLAAFKLLQSTVSTFFSLK